jgi:hypothetical protein
MIYQAGKKGVSPATINKRMTKLVEKYNKTTPWPEIPDGDLIVIADAMVEIMDGVPNIVYFILLRNVSSVKAVITPFLVVSGRSEGLFGWERAFLQIDNNVRKRIKAIICDGASALLRIAHDNGWILQRCQFHLRARIVKYCSLRRFGKRPQFSREILELINIVLRTRDKEKLDQAILELIVIKDKITAYNFKTIVSGFIKNYEDYRSYLKYPELNLPNTSNTAENFIGQIRNLQRRARGFRSLKSLTLWIEAFCKFKKTVTCNPKISIPN